MGGRRISELAVACWAYDTTQIIAATPMEMVDGRGMYNYHHVFSDDCGTGTAEQGGVEAAEGKACLLEASRNIGGCHLGYCRDLCVDQSDCGGSRLITGQPEGSDASTDASDIGDSAADGSSAPSMLCEKTDHYIGFCVEPGTALGGNR